MKARCLTDTVEVTGIGVHSGAPVHVWLQPLPDKEWRRLWSQWRALWTVTRVTEQGDRCWPVHIQSLRCSQRATSLGDERTAVSTVEHLLAVLLTLRVVGVNIRVEGPEIPILDGSSKPWCKMVETFLQPLSEPDWCWPVATLAEPLAVHDQNAWAEIRPADQLEIDYSIEYAHPKIGFQRWRSAIDAEIFARDLAPARTFGFIEEFNQLLAQGLARGAGPHNTLILDTQGLMNGPLRFDDEFVRHKVIDLLGDLALLGGIWPLVHIRVHRGGHRFHTMLVQALARNLRRIPVHRSRVVS